VTSTKASSGLIYEAVIKKTGKWIKFTAGKDMKEVTNVTEMKPVLLIYNK